MGKVWPENTLNFFVWLGSTTLKAIKNLRFPLSGRRQEIHLVRATGLEPARSYPLDPKSNASANFAMPAYPDNDG